MTAATGTSGKESSVGADSYAAADRVVDAAHDAMDRAVNAAIDTGDSIRDSASRTADKIKGYEEKAALAIDEGVEKARSYVERNPFASAGIAFAAGLVLSALVFRR